ncbi:hypothetical protein TOPH_02558 [Tolypocladium ophioglossoides CBS 100239]|uniref:Uncharacterized protein n=1 Tax=Tolypocladium ophioglossoides (strain CBS 100239) TaxID=1163406 RepID=A0A0L0NFG9_TOLOC|nr:hypothetical protein TOPH_02558 [Tolypocladium ophioglossoides CBS 100239]
MDNWRVDAEMSGVSLSGGTRGGSADTAWRASAARCCRLGVVIAAWHGAVRLRPRAASGDDLPGPGDGDRGGRSSLSSSSSSTPGRAWAPAARAISGRRPLSSPSGLLWRLGAQAALRSASSSQPCEGRAATANRKSAGGDGHLRLCAQPTAGGRKGPTTGSSGPEGERSWQRCAIRSRDGTRQDAEGDKDRWAREGRAEEVRERPLVCEWKKSEEWKRRRIRRKRAVARGGGGEADEDTSRNDDEVGDCWVESTE